jgi:hypothetical protein
MSDLMHYTSEPVTLDSARIYEQDEPTTFGKPRGLWVSVAGEDDWPAWVRGNMPNIRLTHAYRVTLADDAKTHAIANDVDLDRFTATYAVETAHDRRFPWRGAIEKWPIDWRRVARDYDGLIIAPYQWSCRMEYDWYYGWDCASGCIWNLDAIADLEAAVSLDG